MLLELHIRNFALIERADLTFQEGLTVLSGETGAGKSILIDSISAALGGKTGGASIRTGAEYAYIELLFSVEEEELLHRIRALGVQPEADGTLILTRKIMPARSVFRVNDETVTAALLKKLTALLIDIHGQHEVQTLFDPGRHLELVDLMAADELATQKAAYSTRFRRYAELKSLLRREADQEFRERERELLAYEVEEIERAELMPGEEEAIRAEFIKIRNSARIQEALASCTELLSTDAVSEALRKLSAVEQYAPELRVLSEQLSELDGLLGDALYAVREQMEGAEFDEERLQQLSERLDLIHGLQDKYGDDVSGILAGLEKKRERLDFLLGFEEKQAELKKEEQMLAEELKTLAESIRALRIQSAGQLEKQVPGELRSLNFPGADFSVQFSRQELGANGCDGAEFYISTNPGEPLKPLRTVASGGELSRIMLALKTVLADRDEIPTQIFDEIDAGISGRTAQKVSEKLFRIGGTRQVLCITHLPQIAAMADHHYLIEKESDADSTRTAVREISGAEITAELGRLIGGSEITAGVLKTAEEMKLLAERGKQSLRQV